MMYEPKNYDDNEPSHHTNLHTHICITSYIYIRHDLIRPWEQYNQIVPASMSVLYFSMGTAIYSSMPMAFMNRESRVKRFATRPLRTLTIQFLQLPHSVLAFIYICTGWQWEMYQGQVIYYILNLILLLFMLFLKLLPFYCSQCHLVHNYK